MGRTRVVPLSTMCARALSAALAAPRTRRGHSITLFLRGSAHVTDGHSAWARHGSSCSKWSELLGCKDDCMAVGDGQGHSRCGLGQARRVFGLLLEMIQSSSQLWGSIVQRQN